VHRAWGGVSFTILRGPTHSKRHARRPLHIREFGKREVILLFICFLNWTEQGAKAVKGVPARHESLKAEIAQLGGRLVGGYVTRGQYDVVLVLEMPDGDAMTKLTVALISRGNVRTTTVRAHSMEEFGKLAAEVS
jgi:uncharacterized protein with GYD domain